MKIIKKIILAFFTAILALVLFIFAARIINFTQTKITSKNGVQENLYIEINGIKQFLRIRGQNKENPVIIFIHGGPASPMGYIATFFQKEIEKDYTVIHYDQRGCGRTYYKNKENFSTESLSVELLLSDLDHIVSYAKTRFNKQKVIILGHSWGTVLGMKYGILHPENVLAFLAIGQVVDGKASNPCALNEAIKRAKSKENSADAQKMIELINTWNSFEDFSDFDLNIFMQMRKTSSAYLTVPKEIPFAKMIWQGLSSWDMNFLDMKWFLIDSAAEKIFPMQEPLMDYTLFKFCAYDFPTDFNFPVAFISGSEDWITPKILVEDYYKQISAPKKTMEIIKDAGHSPFMDSPKEFSDAVLKILHFCTN